MSSLELKYLRVKEGPTGGGGGGIQSVKFYPFLDLFLGEEADGVDGREGLDSHFLGDCATNQANLGTFAFHFLHTNGNSTLTI